jgi:hypothetical protein
MPFVCITACAWIHRCAMNVCLKARDSQANPLDADTGSGPVSWKLTRFLWSPCVMNETIREAIDSKVGFNKSGNTTQKTRRRESNDSA